MRPVAQLIDDPEDGDCVRACLATILERDPATMPPCLGRDGRFWLAEWNDYLRPSNLFLMERKGVWPCEVGVYYVASIPSPRYPGKLHAVVMFGYVDTDGGHKDRIVWDPSPYRDDPGRYDKVDWSEVWQYHFAVIDPRRT